MKLYSFYTPSHRILKEHWFVPSLKDDYELIFEEWDQSCSSGEFMETGWIETMHRKVDLIIRAVKESWGDIFIHSDVDVQFFSPTKEVILELMDGKDMLIQRNDPTGNLCAGFFACRANDRTLALWQEIKNSLGQNNKNDQDLLNDYLRALNRSVIPACFKRESTRFPIETRAALPQCCSAAFGNDKVLLGALMEESNRFNIHWSYLPESFFGGGTFSGKMWGPGMSLIIPEQPVMHHANWTVGVDHKMAQLEYMRNQVIKNPFAMRHGVESRQ